MVHQYFRINLFSTVRCLDDVLTNVAGANSKEDEGCQLHSSYETRRGNYQRLVYLVVFIGGMLFVELPSLVGFN